MSEHKCTTCNSEVKPEYCVNCDKPVNPPRIDARYIKEELGNVLLLENGLLLTVREILLRPGKSTKEFISRDRSRLVKPVYFLIVTSLIYSLANHYLGFEDGYMEGGGLEESSIGVVFSWMQSNYGFANLIFGVFIAFWTRIFFRKFDYNIFEIVILLCYVMGVGMLVLAVFGIAEALTHLNLIQVGAILLFGYITWSIGQFFDKKAASYFKGFLAYLLGYITVMILIFIIGLSIDLISA